MGKSYQGSCLCGEIQFSVTGFSQQVANCHCTMCRKFHGAAYGTLVGVTGLRWVSGTALRKDFTAPNGTTRTFCSTCGSSLGFRIKGQSIESIEIAISTFDVEIPVEVDAQIYTHYKANWCKLVPNLVTFSEGRVA